MQAPLQLRRPFSLFMQRRLLKRTLNLTSIIMASSLLLLTSCAKLTETRQAAPDPDASFIQTKGKIGSWKERAPVHKIWFKDRENFTVIVTNTKRSASAPLKLIFL